MTIRILIAEDEDDAREALADLATNQGYKVTTVTNGVDLLIIAAEEQFDIIITDLMMKDLDGAAATEIMKMQGNTTPVIAITGVLEPALYPIQDKFARIFKKPVNVGELFNYVNELIR
jgi:two-component system response regulator MprA